MGETAARVALYVVNYERKRSHETSSVHVRASGNSDTFPCIERIESIVHRASPVSSY